MRLEWLEDILAVIETGSFVDAAKRRFLSQPAFSRRIRMIEEHIGAELFDRTKKPVQLKSSVASRQPELRELIAKLREFRSDLKQQDLKGQSQIVIASQHAITTSAAPALIKNLATINGLTTLLRSENRDECYSLLMTKQVDLILVHHSEKDEIPSQPGFFNQHVLARERFIPVCLASEESLIKKRFDQGLIPVIGYPSDSFLGQVLERQVFFQLREAVTIQRMAETSLTLAILPMTLAGVGVGWLPDSLVASDIEAGRLKELSEALPSCELKVMAISLRDTNSKISAAVWATVETYLGA